MTEEENVEMEKPYRVSIWRVSKGYVRYKVHADSIEDAVQDWVALGSLLRDAGERIEGEGEIEGK